MKQLLNYIDILIEVPCYLGYLWAADQFCKKYMETSKMNEILFMIFAFSGWMVLNTANRWCAISYIFVMMVSHILFIALVLWLFQADWEKKVLAASMLIIVLTLARNFCNSFLSCLTLIFQYTVKAVSEPLVSEWEAGLIGYVSLIIVILAVYWMAKRLDAVFYGKTGTWYLILAVPLLMVTAVIDVASWGASRGIMVRSGGNMGLYYDQIFSHMEMCILTGLSMFAAGFYVFGMARICLEQEKNSRYHSQIAVYKMLEEQYRQSERLRHDMKNHIIALSGLFQSKEWEKLGDYLNNMKGSCLEHGGDMTGNKAVDALLYEKRKWAEQENIKWECDVEIPRIYHINEFDLCVLFGNILDNALEACGKLENGQCRFVKIQAKMVRKCFLLEVKNSMVRTEPYKDGFTNKENPREHGIGLLNVKDVVSWYNGVVNIEAKNGIFVISILMPLNTAAYNINRTV